MRPGHQERQRQAQHYLTDRLARSDGQDVQRDEYAGHSQHRMPDDHKYQQAERPRYGGYLPEHERRDAEHRRRAFSALELQAPE